MTKKNSVFVVTGRCGCELNEPFLVKSIEEGEKWIRQEIAELVISDFSTELEEKGIIPEDSDLIRENNELKTEYVDAILKWGSENNYCSDNIYMFSSDWTEYTVTELKLLA